MKPKTIAKCSNSQLHAQPDLERKHSAETRKANLQVTSNVTQETGCRSLLEQRLLCVEKGQVQSPLASVQTVNMAAKTSAGEGGQPLRLRVDPGWGDFRLKGSIGFCSVKALRSTTWDQSAGPSHK